MSEYLQGGKVNLLERILIIIPPFGSIEFPSLEAASVAAACRSAGHLVETRYLSHDFSSLIGERVYSGIASLPPPTGVPDWVGAGETAADFPPDVLSARRYPSFEDYLLHEIRLGQPEALELQSIRSSVRLFQREVITNTHWNDYKFILVCCRHNQLGFSISFISALYAHTNQSACIFLFGGHIADRAQARALLTVCPGLSGVVIQSAPKVISQHVSELLSGIPVPGVVHRDSEEYLSVDPELYGGNLDVLPDYEDYYSRYVPDPVLSVLPLQTSQGCAWADKVGCTFCGLVAPGQRYKEIASRDLVERVERLCDLHETLHVVTADLMMSQEHARTAFLSLEARHHDVTFFYEIRPNISKEMLIRLWNGGVTHVEVGIESFDTEQLTSMRKGSDCLRNIAVLKWLNEIGFVVSWSVLYGFERETDHSISLQTDLIRGLIHLQPPLHATRVRVDRYSPMFVYPGRYGIREIRPAEHYFHIYSTSLAGLSDLAKFFEHSGNAEISPQSVELLQREVSNWKRVWRPGLLYYRRGPSFIKVFDSRGQHMSITTLRGWEAELYRWMDTPVSEATLLNKLRASNNTPVSYEAFASALERLANEKLIVRDGGRALALAPHLSQEMLNFLKMQQMLSH